MLTPMALQDTLKSLAGNEQNVIEMFAHLSQKERVSVSKQLGWLSSLLTRENKWQPVLLPYDICIPVETQAEALKVQETLVAMGCGYFHGVYPLSTDINSDLKLSAIFVNIKGILTVTTTSEDDKKYLSTQQRKVIAAKSVLDSSSLSDLITKETTCSIRMT